MRFPILSGVAVAAGFALAGQTPVCEPPREMQPAFANLNFLDGSAGSPPPGWYLGPEWFNPSLPAAHEARTVSGAECRVGSQCARVYSVRPTPPSRGSFLYQVVNAAQYRGKMLRYQADVQTEAEPDSVVRLLVRVHRLNCDTSFRDDMGNHPITTTQLDFISNRSSNCSRRPRY
jgi:hypothetical protein